MLSDSDASPSLSSDKTKRPNGRKTGSWKGAFAAVSQWLLPRAPPATQGVHAFAQPPAQDIKQVAQDPAFLLSSITQKDIEKAWSCGKGGFGVVMVLTHHALGEIALKRLNVSNNADDAEVQKQHALREGQTWERLEHPNVLRFLGVLEISRDIYLVSPYVTNGSLKDYIVRFPEVDRPRLLREAAYAIIYLHESGIIHGDIKAANMLISDDVHILLCDFGLAWSVETDTSVGQHGTGTIAWKSPELFQNEGKTFESDIWAFGMTIYEVLSSRRPFDTYTEVAMMYAIVIKDERPPKEPSESPSGVSYGYLWSAADECWKKNPRERQPMVKVHATLYLGWTPSDPPTASAPSLKTDALLSVADGPRSISIATLQPEPSTLPTISPVPLIHQDIPRLTSSRRAPDPPGMSGEWYEYDHNDLEDRVFPLKVTDYAYKVGDKRHKIVKLIDLDNPVPMLPPAPGGLIERLGPEGIAESGKEEMSYSIEAHAPGFVMGWYRALHSFKAEGMNEISLTAGNMYEVDSRGGHRGMGG